MPSNILDIFLPAIKTHFQWSKEFVPTDHARITLNIAYIQFSSFVLGGTVPHVNCYFLMDESNFLTKIGIDYDTQIDSGYAFYISLGI